MDGVEAIRGGEHFSRTTDSSTVAKLRERLERLLREAADVEVGLTRADETIRGVLHYFLIEGRVHESPKQLNRQVQQQGTKVPCHFLRGFGEAGNRGVHPDF